MLQAAEVHEEPGYRWRPALPPQHQHTGFTRIPGAQSGVLFTNRVDVDKAFENHIRLNGGGVTAGDIDGDGWIDFYVCGIEGGNALYRNLGNWKFENITASAGVACADLVCAGALLADIDGDGDLDLLVTTYGSGVRVFRNDGKGNFTPDPDSNLPDHFGVTTLAAADIDGNGTLDLYVTTYGTKSLADEPNTRFRVEIVNGQPMVSSVNGVPATTPGLTNRFWLDPLTSTIRENGEPDILFLNDGHGKFKAVSWTDGAFLDEAGKPLTEPPRDWGLSTMLRDINGDGAPDIYTCNDLYSPDRIWINDGHGHFRAMASLSLRCTSMFSMGIDFADINRDGLDDFVVVDMLSSDHQMRMVQTVTPRPIAAVINRIDGRPQVKRNTLFLNLGDGNYSEIAQFAGLDATDWSWASLFLDVDLDGYEDLLITTGHARDSLNGDVAAEIERRKSAKPLGMTELKRLSLLFPPLKLTKKALRNTHDLKFKDVSVAWGFGDAGISHGMCAADLDNDGDLDIIVNNLNDAPGLYRNDSTNARVSVRLKGATPNTAGIGAKIRLLNGAVPVQQQEIICGGRYLSGDDPMRMFAAGAGEMTIEVTWRRGRRSLVKGVRANRVYEIDETSSVDVVIEKKAAPQPLFEDVSAALGYVHHENAFDDFARQPLLSRKLSQLGPGAAWVDLNHDGRDDLIIGAGRGGEMGIFINESGGKFSQLPADSVGAASDDQTGIVGWNGSFTFGLANYETKQTHFAAQRFQSTIGIKAKEAIPGWEASAGPLVAGDFNADGAIDLFVGGRAAAGRYPEPVASRIYLSTNGHWELTQELNTVGMVSAAVATDLDGDGFPELALACDWGPVRVFKNDHGQFTEITERLGLGKLTGWWNSITAGDFDGDGRMDLVAGNFGENTKYARATTMNLCAHFGEWDGRADLLETYCDFASKKNVPVRGMDFVVRSVPSVKERYTTYAAFGAASAEDILNRQPAAKLHVQTLQSMIFFNRGDHFEPVPLPPEAQFSPVFGISVADVDGDGAEDILLSQNFFGVDEETSRYDAGRGLLLRGDGHGRFTSVPGQDSGILVYGQGRGVAVCDYDGDGRVDVLMAQNAHAAKLFHNVRGKPGLRVKLEGPLGNPNAIGAAVRMGYVDRMSPAREIHAGSGYWSQDSSVPVFAREGATSVWIRWPGGKTMTLSLSGVGASKTIVITEVGQIRFE
jgi:hypothetical protein